MAGELVVSIFVHSQYLSEGSHNVLLFIGHVRRVLENFVSRKA
jgi:hypothetical protein